MEGDMGGGCKCREIQEDLIQKPEGAARLNQRRQNCGEGAWLPGRVITGCQERSGSLRKVL